MNIVDFNVDEATYVGSEEDGCYYQCAEHSDAEQPEKAGWYVTVVVDSDTGGFVMDILTDDGPYPSEEEASGAGRGTAIEWCINNGVLLSGEDLELG
jgi:hypothetical protein